MKTYSIVGLGKLGASMMAAIAGRGFNVIGVDVVPKVVDMVNNGLAPVQETGLEELISNNRARIRATLDFEEAILASDVTFVVVPTPSDERGAFSLQYAARAFQQIGRVLRQKRGYHNVVLTSTVLPGSTRYGLLPILERESGKVCGPDFGLCYSPEFIALGSVIRDFLNPDFLLIGEYDEKSGAELEACYSEIMMNNPPCRRMSIENAELAKIALNTFVTTKITFANMLADLCERIPGGDVDVVTGAIGLDRRIGRHYLTGALGYSGPCFPRDNIALSFLGRSLNCPAELAEITDRMNRARIVRIVQKLQTFIHPGTRVAVLGLAYKPFSHVIEESQAIYIVKALSQLGAHVVAFDPLATDSARVELDGHALIHDSIASCLDQAEVVLITTPDPMFRQLNGQDFLRCKKSVKIVDFWRILDQTLAKEIDIDYIPIGRSVNDEENASNLAELWCEH